MKPLFRFRKRAGQFSTVRTVELFGDLITLTYGLYREGSAEQPDSVYREISIGWLHRMRESKDSCRPRREKEAHAA